MHWKSFHRIAAIVWALLIIPSLIWMKDSVPWLVFMSGYALVAAHWSASEGAKSDEDNKELMQELLEEIRRDRFSN